MKKRFDSNRIKLILPNPWRWPARVVALLFTAWLILLCFGVESGFGVRGATLWVSVILVPTGLVAVRHLRADRKRRHGRLVADRHGLEFDGRPLVPMATIVAAHLITGRSDRVQISRQGHIVPIEIQVESSQDARIIIHALRLETSQGTAQYELPVPSARRWVLASLLAAGVSAIAALATAWSLLGLAAAILVTVALVRARQLVAVGSDGVLVRFWFWSRFVEYRDVLKVKHIERMTLGGALFNGVDLVLRSKEQVRLLAPSDFMYSADDEYPVDPFGHQMKDRLGELMARMGSAGETAKEAKQLRRNNRSAAEWFEELRGIGSGSSVGYRAAPIAPSALWQLLEDPGAEPSVRIGAAAALAGSSAHHDEHRLQCTTATVLAPKLRRALEQIGGAKKHDTIIRALASIHDESRAVSIA